jgi:hypothetical protein
LTAICERLRLNPSRFQEARAALGEGAGVRARRELVPQFVELPPAAASAQVPPWRVVVQQADGLRVELDFQTLDVAAVEAAAQVVQTLAVARDGRR